MRKKQTYIVLDVETTGLDVYKERMIEFAAVKLLKKNFMLQRMKMAITKSTYQRILNTK